MMPESNDSQSFQLEDLLQLLKNMWTHFAQFHHKAFHLQLTIMRQNLQCSLTVFILSYSVVCHLALIRMSVACRKLQQFTKPLSALQNSDFSQTVD